MVKRLLCALVSVQNRTSGRDSVRSKTGARKVSRIELRDATVCAQKRAQGNGYKWGCHRAWERPHLRPGAWQWERDRCSVSVVPTCPRARPAGLRILMPYTNLNNIGVHRPPRSHACNPQATHEHAEPLGAPHHTLQTYAPRFCTDSRANFDSHAHKII